MQKPAPPAAFPPGRGFDVKPGLAGKNDLVDPKKAGRQLRREMASPCDRPPATPTGVEMIFRATEAKTHLEFHGRIRWDDVTQDTSGFPINTVDRWDVEWRALDADGDVIKTEHAALTNATNPSGDTYRFTTARNHGWSVGDRVKVTGCYPQTDYNGTWTISAVGALNRFDVEGNTSGLQDVTRPGEVYNQSTSQSYDRKLRNPVRQIALRKAEFVVLTSDHEAIDSGTNPSGTTYRFNTHTSNDYQVGDYVKVEGVTPNAYNGIWRVTNRVDSDTFEVAGDTGSLGAAGAGDAYIATTAYEYTTRGASGFNAGQSVRISGCKPETQYNGTWDITAILGEDVFQVQPNRDPDDPLNDAEVLGKAFDEDDTLHVIMRSIPRPKTWYWSARVRCRSGEGCWSAFSPWTTPILPWDGADPRPPVPTYGAFPITFDRKGKDEKHKLRLLFTYDEVKNWDVPGGDREDDVRGYDVQIDQAEDGLSWDGAPYRTQHRPANDDDADTTRTAVFPRISRRYWYRARVRTVDRFNRRGDWSAWTGAALPFDDLRPPTPLDVEIYPLSTDRVVVEWADPVISIPLTGTVAGTSGTATLTGTGTHFLHQVDAGDQIKIESDGATYTVLKVTSATALTLTTNLATSPSGKKIWEVAEDPDAAFYVVQLGEFSHIDLGVTPNEWDDVYAHDRISGNRKAFKIKNADLGLTFFARVRSMDAARNRSGWVPAWSRDEHSGDANSSTIADGDGVVVLPGISDVEAEFHAPRPGTVSTGQLDATGEIPKRWFNETAQRLYFQFARMSCDKDHRPSGPALLVQIKRFETDETTSANLFTSGNRLRLDPGEYRSGRETTFEVAYIDPGESLEASIAQISGAPYGQDLDISVWMSPAPPPAA